MKVGALIEHLRDYPRDMEVVLVNVVDDPDVGRMWDGGKLNDVGKVRMKEIVGDNWEMAIATDEDFDEDRETFNAVVLFPET